MVSVSAQANKPKKDAGNMAALEFFLATKVRGLDMPSYNKLLSMIMGVTMVTTSLFIFVMFFGFVMGFVIYPRTFETCIHYAVTDIAIKKKLFLAQGVMIALIGAVAIGLCLYFGIKVIVEQVAISRKVTMSKWTTGKSTCLVVLTVVVTNLLLLMIIFFTAINSFIKSQSDTVVTVKLELLVTECCATILFSILFVCMVCMCCLAANTKSNPMFDALGPVTKTKGEDPYKPDESHPFLSTFYSEQP